MSTHPAIAAALAQLAPAQSQCHLLKAYHDALAAIDWQYEFTEDPAVRKAGQEKVERALLLQAEVDPDGSIWMSYSGAHMHGAPRPVKRSAAVEVRELHGAEAVDSILSDFTDLDLVPINEDDERRRLQRAGMTVDQASIAVAFQRGTK